MIGLGIVGLGSCSVYDMARFDELPPLYMWRNRLRAALGSLPNVSRLTLSTMADRQSINACPGHNLHAHGALDCGAARMNGIKCVVANGLRTVVTYRLVDSTAVCMIGA